MSVNIKLTRLGKIRNPQYRIVVADARTRRNGRAIETIGRYHPKEEPSLIEVDSEDRPPLKRAGFLTRDPRVIERKKYGLKKARKAPQYSKR